MKVIKETKVFLLHFGDCFGRFSILFLIPIRFWFLIILSLFRFYCLHFVFAALCAIITATFICRFYTLSIWLCFLVMFLVSACYMYLYFFYNFTYVRCF